MYTNTFYKSSKPIKTEPTDIDNAKMKKVKKGKKLSRKIDEQIKNINVRFGEEEESSGCTLTFNYEDSQALSNVAIVDAANLGEDVV